MILIKFEQIEEVFEYTPAQDEFIAKIPLDYKDAWDGNFEDLVLSNVLRRGSASFRDKMKDDIKNKLTNIQGNYCIYCGITFRLVGISEREHIADKATYPQFVFKNQNLALACHYCNGFAKKGTQNTVAELHDEYDKCKFLIVHPYLDDIHKHIEFISKEYKVLMRPKDGSVKGANTIEMFGLMDPEQTVLRGALYLKNKKNDELQPDSLEFAEEIMIVGKRF
ncbi:hypothetical protein ACFQT0_17895 [Hymenobacter humi]|uniref:HNH endonuclease n=1 Tax=Hymenobacter humi TaxID=1411620 RepID=A0ABW2U803_9BACT